MATIEVDDHTARTVEFAAKMAGTTPGLLVARLIEEASLPRATDGDVDSPDPGVPVYADYEGIRTHGRYDRVTQRVDIVDGPLAHQGFKSPTGAARAVVGHYKPTVSPHRNGWAFWSIDDGSGRQLQAIRYS